MQKIRSFIALPLNTQIRDAAATLMERFYDYASGIKWVEAENLHLTLKFLGDVDNREIPDVCKEIRRCCEEVNPFGLEIQGVGGFPSIDRARVIWAGVEDESGQLTKLATRIDEQMGTLGFKREFRDYTPHLTLGRLKKGSRPAEGFAEQASREAEFTVGSVECREVYLLASYLEKQGPTYTVMDRVPLG